MSAIGQVPIAPAVAAPIPVGAISVSSLAALTLSQQETIERGTIVVTPTNSYVYTGAGAKTSSASYIDLIGVSNPFLLPLGGSIDTRNFNGTGGYIKTNGDGGGQSGGYIDTSATYGGSSGGYINTTGSDGAGGFIDTRGTNSGYGGGNIKTSAGTAGSGGFISTYGGAIGSGGSINTSNGGGSINTTGVGSIGLGVAGAGTRTTLNGSASGSDKTITLPNATGTVALTNDTRLSRPFRTVFATTTPTSSVDAKYFSTIDAVGAASALELRNFELPYDCKVVGCSATIYNPSASAYAAGGTIAFNLVTKTAETSTTGNQLYGLLPNWTLSVAGLGMTSNYATSVNPAGDGTIPISAGTNLAVQVVFVNLTGVGLRGELTLYLL